MTQRADRPGRSPVPPGGRAANARRPAVLLRAEGITKSFPLPGGATLDVLRDIDLEVREGEIVALLGRSGSGKSTLLRIVAGLIPPSEGRVLYRNRPLRGVNPGVSLVFQTFALLPWLDVQDNVELGLEALGVEPEERAAKAIRVLDLVGLDGYEQAYPKELSGGMRQRVGIARAFAIQPKLLLMDEPFGALDALTRGMVQEELIRVWQQTQQTVFMITHDVDEAILLADRVLLMTNGPNARIAESVMIDIPRPRERTQIIHRPEYYAIRNHLVEFLVKRSKTWREQFPDDDDAREPVLVRPGLDAAPAARTDSPH